MRGGAGTPGWRFQVAGGLHNAEQRLMAGFFDWWSANISLKNLAYSHCRKALVENNRRST